jgi:hypothetical protein
MQYLTLVIYAGICTYVFLDYVVRIILLKTLKAFISLMQIIRRRDALHNSGSTAIIICHEITTENFGTKFIVEK